MRLLERLSSQEIRLVGPFANEDIPKYAILSHRWESDPQQEVSYEDMIRGRGRNKSGYNKIQFCAERAFQDKLKYFWVDTCCINKSYSGEHQKAINSMFRWYQRAERCYVYLADVFADDQTNPERVEHELDTSIANSQWFERGWTLQELVAPRLVEFFSRDHVRLGDKTSLQHLLCRITGICSEALQGQLLTRFSANERFSWMERRKTSLEEDKVYALLGIFDVEVPITYGQGWSVARKLLDDAIDAQDQIIRSLRVTDPCYDKRRIQDTKGGLLPDVYHWVLENNDFKQWRHGDSHKVLWIRGDPGRGKTMLMCGIIDELEKIVPKQDLLAYFFCQTSDSRLNNATAVLRGLLYMLVDQQPSLVSHMERQYRRAGRDLFEDINSWTALTEIFSNILQDDRLMSTIFAVDGLDECIEELPKLLRFVVRNSSSSHRIKWLVSSRHWPSIEQPFNKIEQMLALRLELNPESVSEAIHFYIHHKVHQLALERDYDKELEQQVRQHFLSNADGTFLWVALVYQSLCTVHQRYVRSKLDKFPPGLDSAYKRMMDQIDENPDSAGECHRALAIALIVSRPVTLQELGSFLTTESNIVGDDHWLAELVQLCGFLTIRTGTVFFVHQSAKDYLLAKAGHIIFPAGLIQEHDRLALLCIQRLSSPGVLSDDLCKIKAPGARRAAYSTNDISSRLHPDVDYAGCYWASHVVQSKRRLRNDDEVHQFLQRHFLHWLEAVSWLGRLSSVIHDITQMGSLVEDTDDVVQDARRWGILAFLDDALRFILMNRHIIALAPLQVYYSALAFAPRNSIVRNIFPCKCQGTFWLLPKVPYDWSAEVLRLQGHTGLVQVVAFSPDGKMLASASFDRTLRVWNTTTGEEEFTLSLGNWGHLSSVVFSPDGRLIAAACYDAVLIWNATTGNKMRSLETDGVVFGALACTPNGILVAVAADGMVQKWNIATGLEWQMPSTHGNTGCIVAISPDGCRTASALDCNLQIRDLSLGPESRELTGHQDHISGLAFSPDGKLLASASWDGTIRIWNTSTGQERKRLQRDGDHDALGFSPDGKLLGTMPCFGDNSFHIWDIETGERRLKLQGYDRDIMAMAFSPGGQFLASASYSGTVRIWSLSSSSGSHELEDHGNEVLAVAISSDGKFVASASADETVRVWDAYSGKGMRSFEGSDEVEAVALSHDNKLLAFTSDATIWIYDLLTGEKMLTLEEGHDGPIWAVEFSPDSKLLATGSADTTIRLWDVHTGEETQILEGHSDGVLAVAFSPDRKLLASVLHDMTIRLWDVQPGEETRVLEGHRSWVKAVAFSPDCKLLASSAGLQDGTVRMWDTDTGEERERFCASTRLRRVEFAADGKSVLTDAGNFSLEHSIARQDEGPGPAAALQLDGEWVRCHGQDVLWLPSEYRGNCSASRGNLLVIGQESGAVSIFRTAG